VSKGLEVGLHLLPGLPDEIFIATALGNLAGFELGRSRQEQLQWQILRVETSPGQYHFRLVIRHPERVLDFGLHKELGRLLDDLSDETPEQLHARLKSAEGNGLKLVPLRRLEEPVDYWRDDFWNWLG